MENGKLKDLMKVSSCKSIFLDLVVGMVVTGIAQKRGSAEVYLKNNTGQEVKTILTEALYVLSFTQDISQPTCDI